MFKFLVEALDEAKVSTINLFSNMLARFLLQVFERWKRGVIKDVIYGCVKWFAWKKIGLQAGKKCKLFKWNTKKHDSWSWQHSSMRCGSDVSSLDRLKSCCHHSLRDMCVHTDGAWWKLKEYCTHGDIGNYPNGCIIHLTSSSVGCVSP